jgi:hypothetical protein
MRILTNLLQVIGFLTLLVLALFGGWYLLGNLAPPNVGNKALENTSTTGAEEIETAERTQTAIAEQGSSPIETNKSTGIIEAPEQNAAFCSTLTTPCTPYTVERGCTSIVLNNRDIYVYKADPVRFMCVHPVNQSPYVDLNSVARGGPSVAEQLPPYCAERRGTIGCSATTPITTNDLIKSSSPSEQVQGSY